MFIPDPILDAGLEINVGGQDIKGGGQVNPHLNLLQGVVEASHQLLTNTHCNVAVTNALASIGRAAATDRVYIFANPVLSESKQAKVNLQFAWVQDQQSNTLASLPWQDQPVSVLTEQIWYRTLANQLPVVWPSHPLPKADRTLLEQAGIQSLLLLPIFIEDQFWGFMGLDNYVEYQWSPPDISTLIIFASSLSGALQWHQKGAQLVHNAFHDPLTGLPNRSLFMNRLEHALSQISRYPTYRFAVLFLDLDRFKIINDSLGHNVGDQLLIAMAERLAACLRPGDSISRLGGDEFIVILNDIQGEADAAVTAQRLREQVIQPFHLEGHELFIDVSVGITLSTHGYHDPEKMLQDADLAMYQAKASGKGCCQVFHPQMQIQAKSRSQLERDMRRALEHQEFEVYYQPIVSLDKGKITGFEALVRWCHPQQGLISPSDFIDIAEETGMIQALGFFVLRQACGQLHEWQCLSSEHNSLSVSVNLSAKQFLQPDLLFQIRQLLGDIKLNQNTLKLELTESCLIQNDESTLTLLSQLRQLGIQLYVDDFGAGYSSLSYLYALPINAFKIDRSFINRIDHSKDGSSIIRSILLLASNLEMEVIAEGIETYPQLNYLQSLQCKYGQGYLFSPPISSNAAEALLTAKHDYQQIALSQREHDYRR